MENDKLFGNKSFRDRLAGFLHARKHPALAPFLAGASMAYLGAINLRSAAYQYGLLKTRRLSVPVVSVGNLTVGGSGKTPLCITIAKLLLEEGYRVAVLSRGYGGAEPKRPLVVSDGNRLLIDDPDTAGDEPLLIARRVPKAIVVVSPDRYAAGCVAVREHRADVAILDDGFQHVGLARDLNILAIRGEKPWGNGRVLPWGPLREPLKAMERSNLVAVIGEVGGETLEASDRLGIPVVRFEIKVSRISVIGAGGPDFPPEAIRGEPVYCFAGIASPRSFFETVESLGADIFGAMSFGDHHRYTLDDIRRIETEAGRGNCRWIIMTEKDYVKIKYLSHEKQHNPKGSRFAYIATDLMFDREILQRYLRQNLRCRHPRPDGEE